MVAFKYSHTTIQSKGQFTFINVAMFVNHESIAH